MKHLRCALSWLCYGIGHLAYLSIDRCVAADEEEPGWLWDRSWDLYQWGMCKSSHLDTGDCGLWDYAKPYDAG